MKDQFSRICLENLLSLQQFQLILLYNQEILQNIIQELRVIKIIIYKTIIWLSHRSILNQVQT
jgi:hypothetical protein